MIFPSAGQSVHAVQLKFPGVPQVPKLIRTDSEKKLPVTDVEQTAKGNKVKFVHKGIHLVMYEDSETSEKEVIHITFKLYAVKLRCSNCRPVCNTVDQREYSGLKQA
jgi:hypothetical protein